MAKSKYILKDINMEKRSIGFLLGIGICLMPYFFSWYTLRKGFSWLARIISFGWLAFTLIYSYQGQEETQKKTETERQQIIELESKANRGNVDALLQLAKKMNDGYLDSTGHVVKNIDKEIEYLDIAKKLGSNEAEKLLIAAQEQNIKNKILVKQQKEKEAIAKDIEDGNMKIIQFAKGNWIDSEEGIMLTFDSSGDISARIATLGEISLNREDDSRDLAKNVGSSIVNLLASFSCDQGHGYIKDLYNFPQYTQIKANFPEAFFFTMTCPSKERMFIALPQNNKNTIFQFECDKLNCVQSGSFARFNPL